MYHTRKLRPNSKKNEEQFKCCFENLVLSEVTAAKLLREKLLKALSSVFMVITAKRLALTKKLN